MLPVNFTNQKQGRSKDLGTQVTNYLLLLKKRLSIRKQYETTLHVDMTDTMENANQLIDKFMNVIIDYDAYCETEENEVQRRRE